MRDIIKWVKLFLSRHFSGSKEKRRASKAEMEEWVYTRRKNSAKWGVAYSVYDGEELLEASIRTIRPYVDYVIVVWQRVSWYGTPARDSLLPLLEELRGKGAGMWEKIRFIINCPAFSACVFIWPGLFLKERCTGAVSVNRTIAECVNAGNF